MPHIGEHASPMFVRDFAQAAEELGYDGLWVADHVVVPQRSESPYALAGDVTPPDGGLSAVMGANFESLTTLAYLAGVTTRVRLGTSVSVVPLRHPLLNATMLASIDAYSGGRLMYGAGAGWLREEASALAMPWDRRGARTDEHLTVLRLMWSAPGPFVDFEGQFYSFRGVDPNPRPAQPGGPPILIGGHSQAAIERAGRLGDGWIASRLAPAELASSFAKVQDAALQAGRDSDALRLHANVDFSPDPALRGYAIVDPAIASGSQVSRASSVPESPDQLIDTLARYAASNVDHLKISARMRSPDAELRWIAEVAREVLPYMDNAAEHETRSQSR